MKKKGHLFSVAITPTSWSIVEHADKNNPQSKNKELAQGPTTLQPTAWHTLVVECRGDEVVAQLTGHASFRGRSTDLHAKKPGLAFRVGGNDDQLVRFDNLRVWAIK